MKHFDHIRVLSNAIVNQNRRVHELSDAWIILHRTADVGEISQKLNMIEKRVPEAFGRVREILPGVPLTLAL